MAKERKNRIQDLKNKMAECGELCSHLKTYFIVGLLALASFSVKAQTDVCDTSSCLVGKAGKYKIELLAKCSERLSFYIHSPKDLSLANKEILGYVSFIYLDNSFFIEEIFRYPGTNKMEVPIPANGYYTIKITLVIDEQTVSAYFDNECTWRTLYKTVIPH